MTAIHDAERAEELAAHRQQPASSVCRHDYQRDRSGGWCRHCGDQIGADEL